MNDYDDGQNELNIIVSVGCFLHPLVRCYPHPLVTCSYAFTYCGWASSFLVVHAPTIRIVHAIEAVKPMTPSHTCGRHAAYPLVRCSYTFTFCGWASKFRTLWPPRSKRMSSTSLLTWDAYYIPRLDAPNHSC